MTLDSLHLGLIVLAVALLLSLPLLLWSAAGRVRRAHHEGARSRDAEVASLRAERGADSARLAEARHELIAAHEAERTAAQAATEAAAERARLQTQLASLAPLQAELDALAGDREALRTQLAAAQAGIAEQRAQLEAARQIASERQRALDQVGAQMKLEFEALSNRILDEKSRKFTEANQLQIGGLLGPLREQIDGFQRSVLETYEKESRERLGLKLELDQLRLLNVRLGDEATALTRALKGEQRVQGQWGEMLLERLLEASGLEPGRGFETQVSMQGEDGRQRPDAIVHLPEERDLVIDAKVSLVAWERWCAAGDEDSRALEMKAHIASLRNHVAGLAQRNYAALPNVHTVDYVLMFVPVEAALIEAMRADDSLQLQAMERNVAIVSTSTLLATLRTVATVWRNEDRNRNAMEIAERAGRLYDKFHGLMTDLDKVDRNMRIARDSLTDARAKLSSGKGNVVSQIETLQKLGARAQKRLDRGLRDVAKLEDGEAEDDPAPSLPAPDSTD
jgi:DNA recombination protein RmuC